MLIVVAMLSVESIYYAPCEKLEEKSNLVNSNEKAEKNVRKWCKENFINGWSLKHARDIHSQKQRNAERMGLRVTSCGDDMLPFRRCLAASFFLNAALKQPDGTYRALSSGLTVQIHPSSVLFRMKPECLIFDELVRTNHNYIRNISRIDYLWLAELAPHCYALKKLE
ncbi:pre-mRNA-splicing factor ATP-dependent RNA helicase DEAH10 [Olea europaea subsp. europaea]|uniref:Pre-mRNA-splicing factor ATP-dependent RNA helicase DEAH10 n=1 Tax=Olea europaea subsp. europaea TaxID=158383 RepID=A0A8S0T4W5_OLEEU|nr:pre-mRNA-splicing factor ATP-dependent RNA helicase DEAH10 [Olea europaea subsp. europaea]